MGRGVYYGVGTCRLFAGALREGSRPRRLGSLTLAVKPRPSIFFFFFQRFCGIAALCSVRRGAKTYDDGPMRFFFTRSHPGPKYAAISVGPPGAGDGRPAGPGIGPGQTEQAPLPYTRAPAGRRKLSWSDGKGGLQSWAGRKKRRHSESAEGIRDGARGLTRRTI